MHRRRAFILPMGMVFACVLVMLGMSFSSVADLRLRSAIRQMKQDDAQAAADGGLVAALQALAADTDYAGSTSPTWSGAYSTYTVQVFRPPANVPQVGVVPPGCIYVQALGRNAGQPVRSAGALLRRGSWITGVPAVYGSAVTVRHAIVNSYTTAQINLRRGWLLTNSIAPGSIYLDSDAGVYGTISVGVGGKATEQPPTSPTIGSTDTIWQHDSSPAYSTAEVLLESKEFPPVVMPAPAGAGNLLLTAGAASSALPPGTYGNVTLQGADLVLQPGDYVFNSLVLTNAARMVPTAAGAAQIHIHEKCQVAADGSNCRIGSSALNPSYVRVYLKAGATYSQSNGEARALLYGPDAAITLTKCTIWGAVMGGNVNLTSLATVNWFESLGSYRLVLYAGENPPWRVIFRER